MFTGDLAAVRITAGVSVLSGCPQGESRLSFVFIGDLAAVRIIGVSARRELTVICFYRGFSCCLYYRGLKYSRVFARRELTVPGSKRVLPPPPPDSPGPALSFLLDMKVFILTRQVIF